MKNEAGAHNHDSWYFAIFKGSRPDVPLELAALAHILQELMKTLISTVTQHKTSSEAPLHFWSCNASVSCKNESISSVVEEPSV